MKHTRDTLKKEIEQQIEHWLEASPDVGRDVLGWLLTHAILDWSIPTPTNPREVYRQRDLMSALRECTEVVTRDTRIAALARRHGLPVERRDRTEQRPRHWRIGRKGTS